MSRLLFCQLLHLVAIFDFAYKNLGRLKAGNIVLVNYDGCIARNVPRDFLLPLLINETAKSTNVDILAGRHVLFNYREECFHSRGYISLIYSGLFCDLIDDICFRHDYLV